MIFLECQSASQTTGAQRRAGLDPAEKTLTERASLVVFETVEIRLDGVRQNDTARHAV